MKQQSAEKTVLHFHMQTTELELCKFCGIMNLHIIKKVLCMNYKIIECGKFSMPIREEICHYAKIYMLVTYSHTGLYKFFALLFILISCFFKS